MVAIAALAMISARCGAPGGRERAPQFLNQAPAVRFVGIDNCVGCHKDKAQSFSRTGMGRAFYAMSAETAVEDFTGNHEIEIAHQAGLRYRMTRRDGKYFMRQFVLDEAGREIAADEREMQWVIGSGNHSRSYVTTSEGRLFQMPVCWYPEKRLWDLCPGFEAKNDAFGREITETCVFCHNGRMEMLPGERSRYREPFPMGIDCERCHGPGQLHVERWRQGKDEPTGGLDPTIVNPERLPQPLRIQVCFQCHLGDSKASERVQRHGRVLRDFRPGRPIDEAFVPFWFARGKRAEFGISSQADRLLRSRCFTASGGRLECLTCHDPHVSVHGADRSTGAFRERCLGCHRPGDCDAPDPARQATHDAPDDCLACHMRRAEPDDHPHTTFTDHWIRVMRADEATEPEESDTLVPVFPRILETMPEAERAYHEARAYLLKSLDFPEAVRTRMWRQGEERFRRAIQGGFARAEAWFFLGKILQYERRWDDAAAAFRDALALDPEHRDAAIALGTAMAQRGRIAAAQELLRRVLPRWPSESGILAELGRTEVGMSRPAEAIALYDRAIRAEPWKASLHLNRAVILSSLGRHDEASLTCGDAMRLGPVDAGVWKACSEVLAAAGRGGEASEAARRADLLQNATAAGPVRSAPGLASFQER